MNNMKQWQQDISNVVDKNSLDIKNFKDNAEVGKLTARIDNIEAKDREQDVQLSNHGEQLENLFNKINTDVADTKTEIDNTIEQLRLNTNNSITALQTSTDRALDTIKQNTADSITALQTSIDRHTKELDNCVRSVNGVNADAEGNVNVTRPVVDYLSGIDIAYRHAGAGAFPRVTIPQDGLIVIHGNSTSPVTEEAYAVLRIMNGNTAIFEQVANQPINANNQLFASINLPVRKGQQVECAVMGNTIRICRLYPYIMG